MHRLALRFWLAVTVVAVAVRAAEIASPPPHPLVWDAREKMFAAKPGDEVAEFVFSVHNTSDHTIEITQLQPSCGCTVAEMPKSPWILAADERGTFRATVDFKGKQGTFVKTIHVQSSGGTQMLTLKVNIPDSPEMRRARNQQLATMDRQMVFRGECASCHVAPAVGKQGAELFRNACAICHGSEHRASMVPDLALAREPRDAAFWRKWISEGKERTAMPAFAQAQGGPLTPEQIESLVAFALQALPTQPVSP